MKQNNNIFLALFEEKKMMDIKNVKFKAKILVK